MTRSLAALVTALAAAGPRLATGEPAAATDAAAEARAVLDARLAHCPDTLCRVTTLCRIALLERPGGELQELAEQRFSAHVSATAVPGLLNVLREGDAYAKKQVLRLAHDFWTPYGLALEPRLLDLVRNALASDDPGVRWYAARLISARPLARVAHVAADAAEVHPELTVAALRAIAMARDGRGVRWALGKSYDTDPAVREAAQLALMTMPGRAAALLREQLASEDPEARARAVERLLWVAGPDDVGPLERWIERDGDAYPELSERVVEALARLEIGLYRVERPRVAPVEVPEEFRVPPLAGERPPTG